MSQSHLPSLLSASGSSSSLASSNSSSNNSNLNSLSSHSSVGSLQQHNSSNNIYSSVVTGDNEDRLIYDLINRISLQIRLTKTLGGYQTHDQVQQERILKLNEETLILLSATKLNIIASGLSDLLDSLLKRKDKDESNEHNTWAQGYVVNLLEQCMRYQWEHIKSQFRNVQGLDERETIRLKEKEEQILPPPLEESLAKTILTQAITCLTKSMMATETELYKFSEKLVFQLSATNYETVSGKISELLHAIVNSKEADDQLANQLYIIEYLNLNSKRLSELLEKITKAANSFKKERHQFILSQVLYNAVWNWVLYYPMEFVTLCKMCERIPGSPDVLFDILDGWAKKTVHKNSFWPLQTMLLILCPDIMLKLNKGDKTPELASKERFLDNLKKSLKTPKLADVAATCYVDICKASTFVSKSEVSALRYIVPNIEVDLKERLFSKDRTQEESAQSQKLMIECLVASFKISPRKIIGMVPDCLSPDTPSIFKMVLIRSLLRIASEDASKTLPWSPSISDAYPLVSGILKTLFNEYLASVRSYSSLKNATDKKSKQQFEKVIYDTQVMGHLIQLFCADPKLALYPLKTPAQDLEDIRSIITGLCLCSSQFSLPEIADVAAETLLKFHNSVYIESWHEKKLINGFWEISSAVNVSLANALIELKESKPENIQKLITLLEEILVRRNAFIEKNKDNLKPEVAVRDIRYQGTTKLEVALLIHLCSPETDICSKCATCFGLLCEEIDILGEEDQQNNINNNNNNNNNNNSSNNNININSIAINQSIYKKLSLTGVLQTGRQHQQKVIRNLLRRIEIQTAGNFAAWEEVYSKWNVLTSLLQSQVDEKKVGGAATPSKTQPSTQQVDKVPAEVKQEWHNMLGFLVSLSGVTLTKETVRTVQQQQQDSTTNKIKIIPRSKNAPQYSTVKVIDSFIDDLLELIVSDNAFIRETSMSLTGTGTSPAVYGVLFRHLQSAMAGFFGDAGQLEDNGEKSTLFVDQTIGIVKHILDISQNAEDLSIITSFEQLIILILKYVNYLVVNSTSLRIKKNFCALLDVMMVKRNYISFSKETEFRNTLVENIIEWTTDFSNSGRGRKSSVSLSVDTTKVETLNDPNAKNELMLMKKLPKEVDVACITTIASLLRGLALPHSDEEGTNKFSKYFTFFTSLLTRCKQDGESPQQLADGAIRSLSNMLGANIHYEYFAAMGYHEDHETRAAFLRVISNILAQGEGFDTGIEDDSPDKYEKFIELLLEPDYHAIIALGEATQITEADEVSKILVNFCEQNEKTLPILKKVIYHEVAITETVNTLFRRNSVATKMLAAYTKLIGAPYLKIALYPAVKTLLGKSDSMEVDPTRLGADENIQENTARLLTLTKEFIKAIQDSVPQLPLPFREICNYVNKVVKDKFPGNEKVAIGGIMFLRFICPAIITPELFGIVTAGSLSKESRRALVLTTKVLQNLANGQTGIRESYMSSCNQFINENIKTIEELFESFTVISPDYPTIRSTAPQQEEHKEDDIILLHHHFFHSMDKINKLLVELKQKDISDRLIQIMQRLGLPPDLEQNKKASASIQRSIPQGTKVTTNFYQEFMRRFSTLNTEQLKQKKIFYKQGVTKEKYPVFYYIAKRYETSMDMEHLLYLILKTIQDGVNRTPFVLVIDCTLFTNEHQIPLSWCNTWLRHFPEETGEFLKSIIIVNPNHTFKKYTKRVGKLVGRATKKIIFLQNPVKIYDYISESECGLPASTLAVETDVKSTFSPIIKLSGNYHEKSVTLRLTNDLLQLVSIKLHEILGKQTTLVDLYHISSISEANRFTSDDNEAFVIKYDNGSKAMVLKSAQCSQILQAINHSKNRWMLSKPDSKLNNNRNFRPEDIPGTLLNVALLNLGSTRNALRGAAYNMLTALCRNSNFSIHLQLLELNDFTIPSNCTHFINQASNSLSLTEKSLTLEFLSECLHGIYKTPTGTKHLVLDYIRPWLVNLTEYCQPTPTPDSAMRLSKTVNVINLLIDFCIKESTTMKLVTLEKIWKNFGRQKPELVNLVLKCCLKKAIEYGFGTTNCELIGEMIASMASKSPQLIPGKLISKLLRLIQRTGTNLVSELSEHKLWPNIIVYLRIIYLLSFDNLVSSELYLSELLHIICTLFSIGNINIRITTHGLLINTVHSLYTQLVSAENKLQGLPFVLSEFGQPSFRLLFGIGGSHTQTDFTPDTNAKELEKMTITNVEPVAGNLFAMLNACCPNGQCFGTSWHNRWLSFTTVAALSPNPAVQARSLITLGMIARSEAHVNDGLIEQVLDVLRNAVLTPRALQEQNDLIVGGLTCLTKLFEYLPPSSKYVAPLFWVASTFVQLNDPRIFTAAIALLEVMIKTMDHRDQFKESISKTYLQAREPFQATLNKLDTITGVSFDSNFSFAVASHLLKGLKYPSTKSATSRLMNTFLTITAKKSTGANIVGYLASLFATGDEVVNIEQVVAITGEQATRANPNHLLFNPHMLPDVDHAVLLFTLLVTILSHTDREREQVFIYECLNEGIQYLPQAFHVIYKNFIPKLSSVITSSQIEKMMQSSLQIIQHMFNMETGTNANKLGITYLKKLGFQGLPDAGAGFSKQSTQLNDSIIKICGELLQTIDQLLNLERNNNNNNNNNNNRPILANKITL